MNLNSEVFLYTAYLVTLIEITLGFYMLVNHPRLAVTRGNAILLVVTALNSLGLGLLYATQNEAGATFPTALLAITSLAIQPLLVVNAYSIIKQTNAPQKVEQASKKFVRPWKTVIAGSFYLLALIPIFLILFDLTVLGAIKIPLVTGSDLPTLLYSGIPEGVYTGGFLSLESFTQGMLGTAARFLYLVAFPMVGMGMLIYFILFDRSLEKKERWLAGLLLAAIILTVPVIFIDFDPQISFVLSFISSIVLAVAFSYATFNELFEPSYVQKGSLVYRITFLVLVVSLPLMIALVLYTSSRAGTLISNSASARLQQQSRTIAANVETWLDLNYRMLSNLANLKDIRSMDPIVQKATLESSVRNFPYMEVISITGQDGMEIARSDQLSLSNNSARLWFRRVIDGEPYAYQILLNQEGKPVFVLAQPVLDETGVVTGVIAFQAKLDEISKQLQTGSIGQTGSIFVVDEKDQLIAHPDPAITSWLRNYRDYPPIQALRNGHTGFLSYLCNTPLCGAQDISRTAYSALLSNDWGLIIEQSDAELFAPLRQVQQLAFAMLAISLLIFTGALIYTVRRGLAPVKILTDTVSAIASGDLDREVPLESSEEFTTTDELGFLAQSFNSMTFQLKDLISGLERRVEERTQDVKKRSSQLEAAAQVARFAAGIRDLHDLLTQAAHLISETFGFYHTGIFIIDHAREYAVLQASNSEGGQRMLARGHRLKVGQVGIVGFVASTASPRIALDVGADAVFFNNPDLPQTRSEMALPLIVNQQVIGILDVQSEQAAAFQTEDLDVLQILADQLALAIENTRLLEETNRALHELRTIYGERTRDEWQDRLRRESIVYEYNRLGVEQRSVGKVSGEMLDQDSQSDRDQPAILPETHRLEVPISFRDQQLGAITFLRETDQPAWTAEEERVVKEAISQISAALENARLLEESQARSTQLRLLQEVTAVAASHTNLSELLANVTHKLREGLGFLHCGVILLNHNSWISGALSESGTLVTNTSEDKSHPANLSTGRQLILFSPDHNKPTIFDVVRSKQKTQVLYSAQQSLDQEDILEFLQQRGTATLIVSPLVLGEGLIGFLLMDSGISDRYYSEEDLQLFDQLSLQISSAIDMARGFEQTAQRAEREKKTSEITSRIRETLDIDTILKTTAHEIRQLLDVPEVIVQLVDPEEEDNAPA